MSAAHLLRIVNQVVEWLVAALCGRHEAGTGTFDRLDRPVQGLIEAKLVWPTPGTRVQVVYVKALQQCARDRRAISG